jgi:hypothetical protein
VTAPNVLLPAQATIGFNDGSSADVSLAHSTPTVAIYGFADNAKLPALTSPALLTTKDIVQGETVIALTADGSAVTGIISKVDGDKVYTNLPATPVGSCAVNLDGNLVGIATDTAGLYTSAADITAALTTTLSTATTQ